VAELLTVLSFKGDLKMVVGNTPITLIYIAKLHGTANLILAKANITMM
jgi:hypothetical protein